MTRIARATDVVVLDEENLGPAMRELTIPQRDFVLAYADQGGVNAAEAARRAGYGNTPQQQAVAGSGLLKLPRVLAALREEADSRMKAGAILAASTLVSIAGNPQHRDQYKSAVELLNRAGLVVESVSRVITEDHRTVEEIERRVRDLAERLGLDPNKLLGQSEITDVEYTEVEDLPTLDEVCAGIHEAADEWQAGHQAFDAMMERSE